MGKLLVVVGLLMAAVGLSIMLGLPVGRLPGDLVIRRGQTTVYLPLATSLVVSLVLSLVFTWLRR